MFSLLGGAGFEKEGGKKSQLLSPSNPFALAVNHISSSKCVLTCGLFTNAARNIL
jgi:hypothetical protein